MKLSREHDDSRRGPLAVGCLAFRVQSLTLDLLVYAYCL